MNFETKIVNVSDEENVQAPQMPSSLERQILVFGDNNTNVGIAPFANCEPLVLGHTSYLVCKGNSIRS